MNWSLISAANNEEVLDSCLLSSPGIDSVAEVIIQRGHSSAAAAYNSAIDQAKTDLLVFAHQDVYLPESWNNELCRHVDAISASDPNWGVLGVWGMNGSGQGVGFLYCGYTKSILGSAFDGAMEVQSLDEVVLIFRKATGLRFDAALGGFHMYGTDICLQASAQSRKSYAVAAFCVHNSSRPRFLPVAFWRTYLGMRRKWASRLPVRTSCVDITRSCWPMLRWNLVRAINLAIGRDRPPTMRARNAGQLYRQLLSSGRLVPSGHQGSRE
jgi:hypothetical protein